MTNCLGTEPEYAEKVLRSEGYSVTFKEVRSKKGVESDTARVIRQRLIDDKSIELCFAFIKSSPDEAYNEQIQE